MSTHVSVPSVSVSGQACTVSVAEVAPARLRGIYAGVLQTAYPFGWFLASLLAAPLLVGFGWRAVFVFLTLFGALGLAIATILLSPAHAQTAKPSQAAKPSGTLRIGVTLHPYYSWTANVVGNLPGYEVRALLPGDIDAGDYQPRPQDIKRLADDFLTNPTLIAFSAPPK